MDRDGDIIAHGLKPPDELIQILSAEDLIRVAHEKEQKLVFLVFERNFRAAFEDLPCVELCRERTGGNSILVLLGGLQPLDLRQMRLDSCAPKPSPRILSASPVLAETIRMGSFFCSRTCL